MAQDPKRGRHRALRRGWIAEYLAAFALMVKGYRILTMRYRLGAGEIDIIARKGDLVIFVEVKARRDTVAAIHAVSTESQKRIRNASLGWLARQRDAARLSQRYDIVTVAPFSWPRHFPDAF